MKCDWIIFYSEASGRHGCVPFKSKAANHTRGKAKGMFTGTLNEAIEECKRRDREAGITGIFKRRYTPKEKAGVAAPTNSSAHRAERTI